MNTNQKTRSSDSEHCFYQLFFKDQNWVIDSTATLTQIVWVGPLRGPKASCKPAGTKMVRSFPPGMQHQD
jgi:hypothetical protein